MGAVLIANFNFSTSHLGQVLGPAFPYLILVASAVMSWLTPRAMIPFLITSAWLGDVPGHEPRQIK